MKGARSKLIENGDELINMSCEVGKQLGKENLSSNSVMRTQRILMHSP